MDVGGSSARTVSEEDVGLGDASAEAVDLGKDSRKEHIELVQTLEESIAYAEGLNVRLGQMQDRASELEGMLTEKNLTLQQAQLKIAELEERVSEQEGELTARAQSWGELQHTLETEIAALRAQQHADTAKQDDMKALIQELTIQVDALSERNHLLHEKAEQAEALTLAFRDRPPASLRKSGFGLEEFERLVEEVQRLRASAIEKDALIAEINEQVHHYSSSQVPRPAEAALARHVIDAPAIDLAQMSVTTAELAKTHYELQNSVHRMTKEQLELNDVMSNFKAKLPLEMQDWQAPPEPTLEDATDINAIFTRTWDGNGIRLNVRESDVNFGTYSSSIGRDPRRHPPQTLQQLGLSMPSPQAWSAALSSGSSPITGFAASRLEDTRAGSFPDTVSAEEAALEARRVARDDERFQANEALAKEKAARQAARDERRRRKYGTQVAASQGGTQRRGSSTR